MPARIALIRHGQTEWSANGRHTSVTDIDLTPAGEQQAGKIGEMLRGLALSPVTVRCSPRHRSRRTAELAGLTVDEVVPDLAEWNYGDYEGITSAQVHQTRPGWSIFADGAPGGETPQQVSDRADRVLALARDRLVDGDVALVGHGHMSRVLAVRWVGLPILAGNLILMDPAAITVLGRYHDEPCIEHANVVPFLPGSFDE